MIKPLSPLTKKLLLASIIFIGAFLRLHQIVDLPPGDDFDPAYYGLDALRILEGEWPVYLSTNFGREPMFSYAVAGAYLVLGPGTLGIHLASAFIAIVSIPALFLVGNEWFKLSGSGVLRQWGGMLSALILALSYWHLNWSRYGVRAILIPLFFSLTAFFLLRGFRRRQTTSFAVAGILLGLSFYTYTLAQLLPLLILMIFLFEFIAQHSFNKRDGLFILLVFAVALLLLLPLVNYAFNHPGVINQRVSGVSIFRDSTSVTEQFPELLERGRKVLLMLVYEGESSLTINLPGRPSLNPFLSLFLIIGIVISFWHWRQPRYLLLLTWLAVMIAPAVLADKAAMSKRALGALPAVILLISLGLLWPLDAWIGRRR